MVIGVDQRRLLWGRGTGAASYAAALCEGIGRAGFAVEKLVDATTGAVPLSSRPRRWAAALTPWPVTTNAPVEGVRLASDVFRRSQVHFDVYGSYLRLRGSSPPCLMHWSYPLPLRFAGIPNIYSVLDLIPLLQPTLTPIVQGRARRLLQRLRHEAAQLVTISETSRQEIIATLGWPEDRITNTCLAVNIRPQDPVAAAEVCAAAGLQPNEYFLHAGTVERRKNIARIIAAYRASSSSRALVLAGPDGWGAVEELAGAAGLLVDPGPAAWAAAGRPRIVRLNWIERPALLGLMQHATAVLAPSLSEGFGLPAIEAMALGTPALTSRGGAPQEVTGDAALLVDPVDVYAIATGIAALDANAGLRDRLRTAGRRRAEFFTPAAYAIRLGALYRAVLDRARIPDRPADGERID